MGRRIKKVDAEARETFTITELADEFSITARAIRFYEDKGLLEPMRCGLNRVYRRRDRARLRLILRGRRLGFTLRDIKEMLDLYDPAGTPTRQVQVTLDKSREQLVKLEKQRHDIDEAISELRQGIAECEAYLEGRKPRAADAARARIA
ncbi:MerR family transcriptional regulator [Oceanibacterium hippocampi]|uniref:HTH-type transcriptional regulator CueR n=1 Tax=Oceanibacterium hippocampi TaxID=745714 RepID=A0A1Y5RZ12_9PROT|nr:MerR family transcriptional regulator [Oceanibacterium hippocampi]SLN28963.1 HTH-type transcriptional regulator CueR [Oceanibacterium hippocampi]